MQRIPVLIATPALLKVFLQRGVACILAPDRLMVPHSSCCQISLVGSPSDQSLKITAYTTTELFSPP